MFVEIAGRADEAYEVEIGRPAPDYCGGWQVATALPRAGAEAFGFGTYRAADYAELIDHPVEMGTFTRIPFEACGVPHDVILTGRFDCDGERLAADLAKICEHHIRFFGEPAPMDYYQFQVLVVGDGYGGLEHRASTSLIASRKSLPQPGDREVSDDYRDFLGLCSHEYFHSWNVKRIKPDVFESCDLQREVYTPLLWAFEGITSYYDELALVRAGLIDEESYLELLGQAMTRVARGRGRTRQSVAESSFNAWTKFYQQDENAANAIVSYYTKGALVAACIDLQLREISAGRCSLDDVMRRLWQAWRDGEHGVAPRRIQDLVCELAGADLSAQLDAWIDGTGELPLPELLGGVGVAVETRAASGAEDKGGKPVDGELPAAAFGALLKDGDLGVAIQRVDEAGAAQLAGLAAGDEIVAVSGLRLKLAAFEQKLKRAQPGERWPVHAFRRDELHVFDVELQPAPATTVVLRATDANADARRAWLHNK